MHHTPNPNNFDLQSIEREIGRLGGIEDLWMEANCSDDDGPTDGPVSIL